MTEEKKSQLWQLSELEKTVYKIRLLENGKEIVDPLILEGLSNNPEYLEQVARNIKNMQDTLEMYYQQNPSEKMNYTIQIERENIKYSAWNFIPKRF